MNERIKEIHQKCTRMVRWDKSELDVEKFAELIVRECLSKIENEAAQYAEPIWAFELINDIREHFGVED